MNVYIVTGCAGFIGSHFVNLLFNMEKDCIVLGVDKLTYAGCLNNMSTFWRNPNFYFLAKMGNVIINQDRRYFIKDDQSHLGVNSGGGSIPYELIDINNLHDEDFYFSLNKISKTEDVDVSQKQIQYEIINNTAIIEDNKKIVFIKLKDFSAENIHIVNFAAESHVDRSIKNASPFIESNINGTTNLLDLSQKIGIKRFLQISTDEVYGSEALAPHVEDSKLLPSSVYSASKASADLLVLAYYKTHQVPVIITRSSNNYGPRQFPEKLIPVFIGKLMHQMKVPLYGDGSNIRDWLYVEDNCRAIYTVLHNGRNGEIYNIASGCRLKNIDLTKKLIEKIKGTFDDKWVEHVEDRKGHDKAYWLNWNKIQTELGWTPQVKFEDGLSKTIKWYIQAFLNNYFT